MNKLIKRNKLELTRKFKLSPVARNLMYGDRSLIKQHKRIQKRIKTFEDFENAYIFGRRVAIPIVSSSTVKRSRIKNKCYSCRSIKLNDYNTKYNTQKTISDFKKENIYWSHYEN